MNEDTIQNHAGAMLIGSVMASAVCLFPILVMDLLASIFR